MDKPEADALETIADDGAASLLSSEDLAFLHRMARGQAAPDDVNHAVKSALARLKTTAW